MPDLASLGLPWFEFRSGSVVACTPPCTGVAGFEPREDVLAFAAYVFSTHEVQDALEEDPEFALYGVCEADEVYVVAGEKGTKQASPRERGLKKRDAEPSSQTTRQS